MECVDGPCAGNFPDPQSFFSVSDVESCYTAAHQCALEALPAYNGRVGAARAQLILQNCLNEVSTPDGDSCTNICAWENPDDSYDKGEYACNALVAFLPWFADQGDDCQIEFDYCMDDCIEIGGDSGWSEDFGTSPIANCMSGVLNGDCPSFVADLEVCGGEIPQDSSGYCENRCLSVDGAWIDDTQDICGTDAGCDDYCDVDIAAAADACGGVSAANESCLRGWLDDHYGYYCEDALDAMLP